MPTIHSDERLNASGFGDLLRRKIKEFGATSLNDLAKKIGEDQSLLGDMQRDESRNITMLKLLQLARKLNTNPHELLTALTDIAPDQFADPQVNLHVAHYRQLSDMDRELIDTWMADRLGIRRK